MLGTKSAQGGSQMSAIHDATQLALVSLEIDDINEIKSFLEAAYNEFQALQKTQSTIDRDTFNLDFDFKLFLGQIDDAKLTGELEALKEKLKRTLNKVSQYANKFSGSTTSSNAATKTDNQTAKTAKVNTTAASLSAQTKKNMPQTKTADKVTNGAFKSMDYSNEEASKMESSTTTFNSAESGSYVNRIIAAQKDVNQRLKEASEKVNRTIQEAEIAERAASSETAKVSEQNKVLKELEKNLEQAGSVERQERAKLSAIIREIGLSSAKIGHVELARAEYNAGEGRLRNAQLELQAAAQCVGNIFKFMTSEEAKQSTVLADTFEQVKQSKVTTEQAVMTTQMALSQFQSIYNKCATALESAERARAEVQDVFQAAEQQLMQAEQVYCAAQDKLIEQQKVVTEFVNLANETTNLAERKRQQAQEALSMQQRIAGERALIADNVRLAVQEAAEAERARIFSELLAKGEIAETQTA